MKRALPLAATVLLLSACGSETSAADEPEGGDEPVTPQALAFVAAEHAGEPDKAFPSSDLEAEGAVGVELLYGTTGEYDGDMLAVAVGPQDGPVDCTSQDDEFLDGCEETDDGLLMWEDETFESDPGVVYVAVGKGDATVLVYYAGPTITEGEDPRDLDLPISVDDLFAIANDPRVDSTTSQEAIDGGADLLTGG
ncbi:hypothetical protein [Nocardioides sp. TF02-7]|uniref:hypothetical protein n=1 Tax=Nocardioides sp. TF02-7 TaxID=2917724 RepID=UPI001F0585EC|nr:hypothetical protein [Nocardioides sp. TF02-7]UMG91074.1 hypothetical protein MF408_12750 [Nocardioides sp. TF02-7]